VCVGSCRNSESREVLRSLPILLGVQRWAFIGRPAQGDGASFSEIMGWSSGGVKVDDGGCRGVVKSVRS
jgi:hypothetical protein